MHVHTQSAVLPRQSALLRQSAQAGLPLEPRQSAVAAPTRGIVDDPAWRRFARMAWLASSLVGVAALTIGGLIAVAVLF